MGADPTTTVDVVSFTNPEANQTYHYVEGMAQDAAVPFPDGLPLTVALPLLADDTRGALLPGTRKPGAQSLRVEERSETDPELGIARILRVQVLGAERKVLLDGSARHTQIRRPPATR